jgi:hypothetical protein
MRWHFKYPKTELKFVFYVFLATIFSLGACKKNQTPATTNVPFVPVDITLYVSDPLNQPIQFITGWRYIDGGNNGIIVYRKSMQEFVAIERTSTALPSDPRARVLVQNDNFTCKDTVSKSTWQIVDGVVIQGPANLPLKLYSTSFDGNILRIRSN